MKNRSRRSDHSPGAPKPGRPGITDWATAADLVRRELRSLPDKDIEKAVIRALGDEPGFHLGDTLPKDQTVRSWIRALENIERIEDDTDEDYVEYVRQLRAVPVAAVELIVRWHRYDPVKAIKAARVIGGGRWSVEKLREEEKKARESSTRPVFGRQYAHKLGAQIQGWVASQLDPDFKQVDDRQHRRAPADILFARESDPERLAAVLIFGPYTDPAEYSSRESAFLTTVVGLAAYCEQVIAIVPSDEPFYWQWLYDHKLQGANIAFYGVRRWSKDFNPVKISRPTPPLLGR